MGPKLLRCIPISYLRNAPGTQAMNICTCENAAAWCRKMGLRLDTGLALQQVLEEEPVRLRLRDDLKLADAAKEHICFGEVVFDALLSRPSVSQRLFSCWQCALSPHTFHVQAARGGVRTHARAFGYERNRKGLCRGRCYEGASFTLGSLFRSTCVLTPWL